MPTQNINYLIMEADELLSFAKDELSHSQEDVNAYIVCQNSKKSIINYLTSFLLKRGLEPGQPLTIAKLVDQCREEDARFDNLDITAILCRHDPQDEAYCLSVEKVSECMNLAQLVRGFATDPVPGY